jgi:hypothetical protein
MASHGYTYSAGAGRHKTIAVRGHPAEASSARD